MIRKEQIKANAQENEQRPQNVSLPIEWHISESIQSRYSTNIVVQSGQHEFTLSFFETQIPLLAGNPSENRDSLEKLGVIRAECVGRIIVAAEQMPGIIATLQASLEAYRESKAQE